MNNIQNFSDSTSVAALLQELYGFRRFGMRPGLATIARLLEFLGQPHTQFPAIHIAGTNGKGSVAALLAATLSAAGYRTGLYTSPHIRRFNERIRVDGKPIGDDEIAALVEPLLPQVRRFKGTFFEATTAIAFRFFADRNVDIAIIETGLGGRLDATNVIDPLLCIITAIDVDHAAYLGDTLAAIAAEKAAIIKRGRPAVIGEPRAALAAIFEEEAAGKQAALIQLDTAHRVSIRASQPDATMTLDIQSPRRSLADVQLDLCGQHQARNALISVAALDQLPAEFRVDDSHIRQGFAHVRRHMGLRGRIELLRQTPTVLLDVAHNPAGIRALAASLRELAPETSRWHIVFGLMQDKPAESMLESLRPICERLYCCAARTERALPAADLLSMARAGGFERCEAYSSVPLAVEAALRCAEPLVICGSFYLADEALAYWEERR